MNISEDKSSIKNCLWKKDLDLSNPYYSTYFLPAIDFELDGKGHSLQLADYVFTADIKQNGCVKNLILKGNDNDRGYSVAGSNSGAIVKIKNYLNLAGEKGIGGICQINKGTNDSCENYGSIRTAYTEPSQGVGGICCTNQGAIKHCTNYGEIVNGGLIGGTCVMNSGSITDSINKASLNTSESIHFTDIAVICIYVGGILSVLKNPAAEGCVCDAKGPKEMRIPLFVNLL